MDERTMALRVIPTEREPDIHVDFFIELGIANADLLHPRARMEFDAAEKTFSPVDPDTFQGILRFAASYLDAQGTYWPDVTSDAKDRTTPPVQRHLIVTDTWAIFARKRSTSFVAADVERLKQAVKDAHDLPAAAALIVTEPPHENPAHERRRYFAADFRAGGIEATRTGGAQDCGRGPSIGCP